QPVKPTDLKTRISLLHKHRERLSTIESEHDVFKTEYERLQVATRTTSDGVFEWDLTTGNMLFNATLSRSLGLEDASTHITFDDWLALVHPDDRERIQSSFVSFSEKTARHLEITYRTASNSNDEPSFMIRGEATLNGEGQVTRIVGRHTELGTDDADQKASLEYGFHDPLTLLPNRSVLIDRLTHAIARTARHPDATFAVLFFDVDRFKNVNDSLGHLAGDHLLRSIAQRVDVACRPSDTVVRFGGDEFVVVVEDISDIRGATMVAHRIQDELRVPFDIDGTEVFATVSIGIALWDADYTGADDILRDADTAMYRAKALGKNRYAVFDEEMHAQVVATLSLENDLQRALERNEFLAYYQPIVNLEDGCIAGFEALVRWQHPERGLLLPGDFITAAEEMGLVIMIDRWVAEEACKQLRAWQSQFRPATQLSMAVNVSSTQFRQPDLVPFIDHILRKTGLYGESMKIEVTESDLMEDTEYASAMIEQLRALNIGISIDDFGTGYSSMSYLRRFGIDTLKIDCTFVTRMLIDEDSSEIVRAIITLAKNLGKETVAEGVETRSQLEALDALGVDRVQGIYISPPVSADAIQILLALTEDSENHMERILEQRLSSSSGAHPRIVLPSK
ncbi:MAG: EAL domain-containing protein, partial [bacterium]|nr:EAL domain-containing protein [bacterium]